MTEVTHGLDCKQVLEVRPGGQSVGGGGEERGTCISDVGAVLQGEGVKVGQALQQSLQAHIP